MSKKVKETINYVLILIVIFIFPSLFFCYQESEAKEIFYSRMERDNEICYERAKRDSAYAEFCNRIQSAAEETFRSSRSSNNFYLLVFSPILFFLVIAVVQLRKQIAELKAKIND